MTTLNQILIDDLDTFLDPDELGKAVTYAGTEIDAVLELRDGEIGGERTVKTADLYVKEADVAAPAYRDAVVIGSDTWRVIGVPGAADAGLWKLEIERESRPVF